MSNLPSPSLPTLEDPWDIALTLLIGTAAFLLEAAFDAVPFLSSGEALAAGASLTLAIKKAVEGLTRKRRVLNSAEKLVVAIQELKTSSQRQETLGQMEEECFHITVLLETGTISAKKAEERLDILSSKYIDVVSSSRALYMRGIRRREEKRRKEEEEKKNEGLAGATE